MCCGASGVQATRIGTQGGIRVTVPLLKKPFMHVATGSGEVES